MHVKIIELVGSMKIKTAKILDSSYSQNLRPQQLNAASCNYESRN